jgi:hypothetical protein
MFTHCSRIVLAISTVSAICGWLESAWAEAVCCAPVAPVYFEPVVYVKPAANSWVFARSTFTHDPMTGARVAQYDRKPPVEPLDDQRAVTSVYRRTRSVNRGFDGSMDTSYQVQSWGNGRGGLDAEWQMFHDVWKESILSGGFFNQNGWNNNGPWNGGWGGNGGNWNNWGGGPGWNNGWNGWNGNWNNGPWNGGWGNQGPPWNGGGPGWGGGPGQGPGWGGGPGGNNGPPNGGWNQGGPPQGGGPGNPGNNHNS